jgi:hypothetical protein
MSNDPAESMHVDAVPSAFTPSAGSAEAARVRKTASGVLLHRAVATLGIESVAQALALPSDAVERLLVARKPMSLAQQRTLGLAILVLSEGHPELRRRASALLSQTRAAADFEAGVTERHLTMPPSNHEWR